MTEAILKILQSLNISQLLYGQRVKEGIEVKKSELDQPLYWNARASSHVLLESSLRLEQLLEL